MLLLLCASTTRQIPGLGGAPTPLLSGSYLQEANPAPQALKSGLCLSLYRATNCFSHPRMQKRKRSLTSSVPIHPEGLKGRPKWHFQKCPFSKELGPVYIRVPDPDSRQQNQAEPLSGSANQGPDESGRKFSPSREILTKIFSSLNNLENKFSIRKVWHFCSRRPNSWQLLMKRRLFPPHTSPERYGGTTRGSLCKRSEPASSS